MSTAKVTDSRPRQPALPPSRTAGKTAVRSTPAPKSRSSPPPERVPDAALFAELVMALPDTGMDIISAIREGYPAIILRAASKFFEVSDGRIQRIVQVPASTASRLEKKHANIDSAASERIVRMGAVTRLAMEVFDDADNAKAWMRQPSRMLDGAAPLDLMDTEPGAAAIRQMLNAIATGGVA